MESEDKMMIAWMVMMVLLAALMVAGGIADSYFKSKSSNTAPAVKAVAP